MPVAYFQIPLSVKPKGGGEAMLVPPVALQGVTFRFVVVREGGEEGVIRVEEPDAVLKKIEKEPSCARLTAHQAETAQNNYPQPKQKNKFRMKSPFPKSGEAEISSVQHEVDEKGEKIIDKIQTVRSGYYLIDVPIIGVQDEA